MALPAEFNTVTIVMDYVDLVGAAGVGSVTFVPAGGPVLHALTSDVLVVPATVTATLSSGHGSVTIPFSNDPDVTPTFSYSVTENVSGSKRSYTIDIPIALAPGPINLADLAPVGVATTGTNFLTRGQADGLYAAIGSGGGGGGGTGLTAGSVFNSHVNVAASIDLAKTADSTAGAGRYAMTQVEKDKLDGLPVGAGGGNVYAIDWNATTGWPLRNAPYGTLPLLAVVYWRGPATNPPPVTTGYALPQDDFELTDNS